MSNAHDDGGPAYPVNGPNGDHPGMTLLDHIAGRAMLSLAAYLTPSDVIEQGDEIAKAAYILAAAMIAEKRRREGGGT